MTSQAAAAIVMPPKVQFALQSVVDGLPGELHEAVVLSTELQKWAASAIEMAKGDAEQSHVLPYVALLAEGRVASEDLGWVDREEWDGIVAMVERQRCIPTPVADRFMDDGKWLIEANINEEHSSLFELPHGFLEVRCNASKQSGRFLVVGGYELEANGSWSADVLQHHDLENGSTYKSLGHFGSRNEAIAALWDQRHLARLPQGREYEVDEPVAASWSKAMECAKEKGQVFFGRMMEGHEFEGKVLYADEHLTVQSLGRSAVVHASPALSRMPAVGELMKLKYGEHGYGLVQDTGQSRGLER